MVRRTQTTLELRDGQSFAIAGLLYTNHFKNQSQLPWIGEVPVLGALFRSAAFQRKETDLVIIVTPRLVRPARPGQQPRDPARQAAPEQRCRFLRGWAAGGQRSQARAGTRTFPHIRQPAARNRESDHEAIMRMPLSPPRSKTTAAGLLLCAGVSLAACTSDQSHEYLAHSDRVTSGAGDAAASNRAMHTINPWSAPSHKTQIDMDGNGPGSR